MSTENAEKDESDGIHIHRRDLDRLEMGEPVVVQYRSNRGNKNAKTRKGEIIHVEALGANKYRFWFYDSEVERKIQVDLKNTLEDSIVKSQKTENASTVGNLTRILASEECTDADGLQQAYLLARRDGDFDVVIAAAAIARNKKELAWMQSIEGSE